MKRLKFTMYLLASTLCSSAAIAETAAFESIVIGTDNRPIDGKLVQLSLTQTSAGLYHLKYQEAFYDRVNGENVSEVKTLARRISCDIDDTTISCSKDLSDLDGPKKVLTVEQTAIFKYNFIFTELMFDRAVGDLVTTTVEDGFNLDLLVFTK